MAAQPINHFSMTKNLKNVDLNLLVIFEAIYATSNISRAAERLGMSQPAVSNALARLRDLIADPLVVRATHGVEPTIKAREMILPVREALGVIGQQLGSGRNIELASYKRLFRIIIVDVLEPIIMPPIMRTIMAQAPGVGIECIQADAKFYEGIKTGTIDLACFAFPIDTTDMIVKPICPLDLVVVSRRDHPAIEKPLDLATFQKLKNFGLTASVLASKRTVRTKHQNLESKKARYKAVCYQVSSRKTHSAGHSLEHTMRLR